MNIKIGAKAKGFKFDDDLYPYYNKNMDYFIGIEGVITKVNYSLGFLQ